MVLFGVAFNRDSLQLSVSTDIRENIFVHPTSSTVRDITPAPKSKKAKIGIEQRREKAQAMLALHDITDTHYLL